MSEETLVRLVEALTRLSEVKIAETELPWRKYRTPYRILLAEMLLIRTRADIVATHFERIALKYPTIEDLSCADEDELRAELHSLGLANRVTYLRKAANYILKDYNGEIPNDFDQLMKIPGIGQYAATAILTFAYGKNLIPADVNILRFISRFTGIEMKHKTKGSQKLGEILLQLSKTGIPFSAENILDFTRLMCKPRKPKCECCPLSTQCSYNKIHLDKEHAG